MLSRLGLPTVFLLLVSCERLVQFDTGPDNRKLVVEAYLVKGDSIKVLVSLSTFHLESIGENEYRVIGLKNAIVIIYHNNVADTLVYNTNETVLSEEYHAKYYQSKKQIVSDGNYKIKVIYENMIAESECFVPANEKVESANITVNYSRDFNDIIKAKIMLNDTSSLKYFFTVIMVTGNWRYEDFTPGSWGEFSDQIIFSGFAQSTENSNQIEFNGNCQIQMPFEFSDESYFTIEIYTVDSFYYNFYMESMKNVSNIYRTQFSIGNYEIPTNITNGYGIFTGMSAQKITVAVHD